jgi:parallel beta-helix repeat protein
MPHQPQGRSSFAVAARRALFVTASVAAALVFSVGQAAAKPFDTGPVSCGDVITRDTALQNDLIDCPEGGLVIGADNITVDLNGHVVDGLAVYPGDPCYTGAGLGISNQGYDGVTIEGGVVREFSNNAFLRRANNNTLRDLTVTDGCGGIAVWNSSNNVIDRNVVHNNDFGIDLVDANHNQITRNTQSNEDTPVRRRDDAHVGIYVAASDDNLIRQNSVSVNSFGISVGLSSSRNVVEKNSVTGNEYAGIEVSESDATIVRKNHVSENVDVPQGISGRGTGIWVWLRSTGTRVEHNVTSGNSGDGIEVENSAPGTRLAKNTANRNGELGINAMPGVIDGGGNKASGNGNPLNCLNVACK